MRYRAQVPTHSFAFVGAEKATAGTRSHRRDRPTPTSSCSRRPTRWSASARSWPSPASAARCGRRPRRSIGYSPIIGGKPLRGMADECLSVIGVEPHLGGGRPALRRARRATGILDGWLVHEGDQAEIAGVDGAVGAAADDRPDGDRRDGARRTGPGGRGVVSHGAAHGDHGSAARSRSCPWPGCRSSGPATTWPPRSPRPHRGCATTTSSSSPARCCPSARAASCRRPTDPEERDALRRKLIDDEAVRVLARKGRTLITENALGLVQAAAGVDGSNVGATELALLPVDPDGSAAALRAGAARAARRRASASSSPTPWAAPGATARPTPPSARPAWRCCTATRAHVDRHGNELVVTEIAVADEIAAAADLVKGKLTAMPGRRRARTDAAATTAPRPARWCGRARRTCSGWAPPRPSRLGRRQAQLLRRSVRRFSAEPVDAELDRAPPSPRH